MKRDGPILRNIEGFSAWDIPERFCEGRRPGLSAMVRLKDEAEFVIPALESIAGWTDEIVIALQGEQSDGTDDLVEGWARTHGQARVLHYPFDSRPNGPGHDAQPRGSVHERAYFYTWCLAQTTCAHAMKWDGDMVALDWLGAVVRRYLEGGARLPLRFAGWEISGPARRHLSAGRPRTACEPRVFRVGPDTWWISGALCEQFTYGHDDGPALDRPGYLHFKWAKALASATTAWPADWRSIDHFQLVAAKARPGEPYLGEWPSVLPDPREAAACA